MYKYIYKNLKETIQKSEDFSTNLYKNMEEKHSILSTKKIPHVLLSAENPLHPAKLKMSHQEVLELLKKKGYKVESIKRKYGVEENSILIHDPDQNKLKHLGEFAAALGQESLIYSNGCNGDHEQHYVNGPLKGRHNKGKGTVFHKKAPINYYSTLSNGDMFTHGLDLETTYPTKESNFIKEIAGSMKKSEDFIRNGTFNLRKSEDGPQHRLALSGAGTKLIHYSPEQGLETIDPNRQGARIDARRNMPEHKMSFYYADGIKPESLVTAGSKSKYVVDLGDKKLYDINKDKHGLYEKAMNNLQIEADKREQNQGIVMPHERIPAFHREIKQAGFHGIYNSSLDHTISHAVGMFHPMKPEAEYQIHERDLKETSSKDEHLEDREKEKTKQFAEANGHHDHEFLHALKKKFGS